MNMLAQNILNLFGYETNFVALVFTTPKIHLVTQSDQFEVFARKLKGEFHELLQHSNREIIRNQMKNDKNMKEMNSKIDHIQKILEKSYAVKDCSQFNNQISNKYKTINMDH